MRGKNNETLENECKGIFCVAVKELIISLQLSHSGNEYSYNGKWEDLFLERKAVERCIERRETV